MIALALTVLQANWKAFAGGLLVLALVGYSYARLHEATVLRAQVVLLKAAQVALQGKYDADQSQLADLSAKSAKLSEDLTAAQKAAGQVRTITEVRVQRILVAGLPVIVSKECTKEVQPVADAAAETLKGIWKSRGAP